MDILKVREVVERNFPNYWEVTEIIMSVIMQLRIASIKKPFGLTLIGRASCGKSTILSFFSEKDAWIYRTDKFTPASFVSNMANVETSKLDKIDLLPMIRDKAMIVSDMAPLLHGRLENISESFSILTRVLDGDGYITNTGTHGRRGYDDGLKFMFISASTPFSRDVLKSIGAMGQRIFFFNLHEQAPFSVDRMIDDLLSESTYDDKVAEVRATISAFFSELFSADKVHFEKHHIDRQIGRNICLFAEVLTRLRCPLNFWDMSKEVSQMSAPTIEDPKRVTGLLLNLAMGHATICGRDFINGEDLNIVRKVAMNSGDSDRTKVFNALIANGAELTRRDVQDILGCSDKPATDVMHGLEILELVEFTKGIGNQIGRIRLKANYNWLVQSVVAPISSPMIVCSVESVPEQ